MGIPDHLTCPLRNHQLDAHEFGWTPGVGELGKGWRAAFMGLQGVGHDWAIELNWNEEICMQVKKQQLEWDMEQWTDSKLQMRMSKLCIFTLFKFFAEYIM